MAFYKSLITGVTAMNAQGNAMGVLSDNIANARTVGFKGSESHFSTLVLKNKPSNLNAGQGVNFSKANHLNQQGLLSASQTSTNFAISGRGFFAVASALDPRTGQIPPIGERLVTRAGDFSPNKDGYLVNAKGYALLGLPASAAGTPPAANLDAFRALVPIKLPAVSALPAEASKQVVLGGNLSATDAVPITTTEADTVDAAGNTVPGAAKTKPGAKVETKVSVYDAKGDQYTLEIALNKTGPQAWTAKITGASGPDGTKLSVTGTGEPIALTFDAKGQLTAPGDDVAIGPLVLAKKTQAPKTGDAPPDGETAPTEETVATLNFNFRFKDQAGKPTLTGFGALTNLSSSTTDGHGPLGYRGIDLRDDGVLYQLFDQGKRLAVASVPVVTFANEDGLEAVSGTAYRVTASSGDPRVTPSNTDGAGKVVGGRLEESNVDLAEEFSDMIVTQRAFQAASKIVTTADAMVEVVRDLKR